MKKSFWLTGLVLLMSLLTNIGYANDTIRWTWRIENSGKYSFGFSGTGDGALAVDWGDGEVTEVTREGDGSSGWVDHEYAKADDYAVRFYALTADVWITDWYSGWCRMKTLDASACPSLKRLGCQNRGLTSLDVSGCTALTSLSCENNQLTSLDVSGCAALTHLSCENNQLTSLDVSGCTALTYLECYNNQMSFQTVAEMVLTLPSSSDMSQYIAPQIHPKRSVRPGAGVAMPERPVIKGTQARLDVYRNGLKLNDQDYTIDNGQLYFEEIGEYKLVVWHDSVREQRYAYDENGDWRYLSQPYGDTVFVTVCDEYESGNDIVYWTWEKEKKIYDGNNQEISFAGTAGEMFVLDWGDGERTLVEGTGESVKYYHDYCMEACSVQFRLYGITLTARILEFGKVDNGSNRPKKYDEKLDVSHCPELTSLDLGYFNMAGKGLTSLDVSKNVKLEYLECSENQLTSLDVSKNIALKHLSCVDNRLSSLDVSKNINLEYLDCRGDYLTSLDVSKNIALTYLRCENEPITSLDLSKNVNLEHLDCYATQLTSLDLSKNVKLKYLDCGLGSLTSLDLSKNVKLEHLECWSNYLTLLDLSENMDLTYLWCGRNNLNALNVSRNVNLETLFCNGNRLTSLDVSHCEALKELNCGANRLTSLDVSANVNLQTLSCGENRLAVLDISRATALTSLYCGQNRLTSLDVSQQPDLRTLHFENNCLTSLDLSVQSVLNSWKNNEDNFREVTLDGQRAFDLSTLPGLDIDRISSVRGGRLEGTRLIFDADEVEYDYLTDYQGESVWDTVSFRLVSNQHSEPQIPLTAEFFPDSIFRAYVTMYDKNGNDSLCEHECAMVKKIYLSGSAEGPNVYWWGGVESLEGIQYFPNLEELECHANALTSLDVSHNPALTELFCPNNRLTSLVLSDKPVLKWLHCGWNRLTDLTINNCPQFVELYCADNRLESMEIKGCPALEALYCQSNHLSDLDVSRMPALQYLYCMNNDLSDLDLSVNEALERVGLTSNHFPLSEIAALRAAWPNDAYDEEWVYFSPQYISLSLPVGDILDLSSEMQLEGVETEVDFGDMAEDAYTFADGRLTFNKAGSYEFRLSNAALRNTHALWDEWGDLDDDESCKLGGVEVFYEVKVGNDEPSTPSDTTANEAALAAAPFAYVQGHTVYLADGLGEVEALTVMGQRVYKGSDRAITLPRPGVYILRAVADGRRCKVIVR